MCIYIHATIRKYTNGLFDFYGFCNIMAKLKKKRFFVYLLHILNPLSEGVIQWNKEVIKRSLIKSY